METKIVVDEENNAEAFWAYVDASAGTPEELLDFVGGEITVSSARAKEIEAWCRNAPGFSDGPKHAPTALLFVDDE